MCFLATRAQPPTRPVDRNPIPKECSTRDMLNVGQDFQGFHPAGCLPPRPDVNRRPEHLFRTSSEIVRPQSCMSPPPSPPVSLHPPPPQGPAAHATSGAAAASSSSQRFTGKHCPGRTGAPSQSIQDQRKAGGGRSDHLPPLLPNSWIARFWIPFTFLRANIFAAFRTFKKYHFDLRSRKAPGVGGGGLLSPSTPPRFQGTFPTPPLHSFP